MSVELITPAHIAKIERYKQWGKLQAEYIKGLGLSDLDAANEFDASFVEAYGVSDMMTKQWKTAEQIKKVLLMTPEQLMEKELNRATP